MKLPAGVLTSGPIFQSAPFASCHAATLVESSDGNVACAFFGGSKEGKDDVCIWLSHFRHNQWTAPVQVGDGVQITGERFACWNPVLFRPRGGPLMLFFKVGPSPSKWWGMLRTSDDDGKTWSHPVRLPEKILGPAKNKPVQFDEGAGGDILSPCSAEDPSTGWHVYFERSSDGGKTWSASDCVPQGDVPKVTQPTILIHSPTTLQSLGRTTVGRLFETWSRDAGRTWQPIRLIDLPNCNSGIDAVTLRDGRGHLLVYNHSNLEKVRYPLNVAFSRDGREWLAAAELESDPPGQYSYPAIIQTGDGLVHIAYTFKRRTINHVVIDPAKLELRPINTFTCPPPGSPTHRSDEFQ